MKGRIRFLFTVLLIVILTGCAEQKQILPTPTATLPSPTATTQPMQPLFSNVLVYDTPEMYKVIVETVQYPTLSGESKTLPMDVFYPSDRQTAKLLPAVILVNGFPYNETLNSRTSSYYPSWGRLIASFDLIAVAYDTRNADDLEAVIGYIRQKGTDLGIDGNKLGFWSMSSNGGLASSFAFQEGREYLQFAAFYYAWIITPDNFRRDEENEACKWGGCLGSQLPEVKQLRKDLPLLMVRCGNDSLGNVEAYDHSIQVLREAGIPLTLINFEEGAHTFDWKMTSVGDNKYKAIGIIQETLKFMKFFTK